MLRRRRGRAAGGIARGAAGAAAARAGQVAALRDAAAGAGPRRSGARAAARRRSSAVLAAAEPLVDRLWRSETDGVDTATPERRAAVLAALDAHAGDDRASPTCSACTGSELRDRFYALSAGPSGRRGSRGARPPPRPRPACCAPRGPTSARRWCEQVLTACLLAPGADRCRRSSSWRRCGCADAGHAALLAALLDAATATPTSTPRGCRRRSPHAARAGGRRRLLAPHPPGHRQPRASRAPTRRSTRRGDQFVKFLDALLADARLGDDIAAANAYFRSSMAEADFAAVRRNHRRRAPNLPTGRRFNGARRCSDWHCRAIASKRLHRPRSRLRQA